MISLWMSEWNYRAETRRLSRLSTLQMDGGRWITHTFISDKKRLRGREPNIRWSYSPQGNIYRDGSEMERKGRNSTSPGAEDGWWMDKQTETSIKNKWKYSPFTDWFYIVRVCCLVTSHCPPHFQMLISSETINKSMARAAGPDCFRGKRESVVLLSRKWNWTGTWPPS